MKKILFISNSGRMRGGETVLVNVLQALSQRDEYELHVVFPLDRYGEFKRELKKIRLKRYLRLPYRNIRNTMLLSLRNFAFSILSIGCLILYCLKNRIDVIYSNTSVNVAGIITARLLNIKHIWHIHELSTKEYEWTPRFLNRLYRKCLLWKHNHTIFVSVLAKETWQKQINACMPDSAVLYSKYREIKVPVLPSNERNEITFGYLGTLDANKNVETLIDCFSELSRGKLIVGGDGELLKILRHKALMSVRSEDIEFVGKVTDLNEFYSRINILVNLSLNESWGLVVPEAMSAGKCVVMTKNTGLTEIFTSGKECVFVDPRSKTEIVRVMNEMMSDENFRNMLVQNANETLRSLDMNGSFDEKILKIVG